MLTLKPTPALLALEDGSLFWGKSIGVSGQTRGEVVFNTAMTGYQEILTDPSYAQQIVTLTCPHIGNVGTNPEDMESSKVWANGLVIKNLSLSISNWRAKQPLSSFLKENGIVAISDIDTRQLTCLLRHKGALNGCIMAGDIDKKAALEAAQSFSGLKNMDLAKEVSTQVPYMWTQGSWQMGENTHKNGLKKLPFQIVAYDFGIKRNILRKLVDAGCHITVVPAQTSAEEALAFNPDGIFLSNGPGDPAPCDYAITAIQYFLEKGIPLFGICLGHQLLGLACHAKTIKMKFGHHGANHPVQELITNRVLISSQNHGFAVEETSLPSVLVPTHRSLFDGSLQGIRHIEKPAFGFQGHPEASPGPHDLKGLFQQFVDMLAIR